jgi:hypothetical protein
MSGRARDWPEYKRLRNRLVLLALGPQALVFASWLVLPTSVLLGNAYWIALGIFGLCQSVLFFATLVTLSKWQCPRCGERFYSWRHGLGIFARKCYSCGLPKYANAQIDRFEHDRS